MAKRRPLRPAPNAVNLNDQHQRQAQELWSARAKKRDTSRTIGLALSGGGIRSATFSLGVLQALARRRKLASFDYLSTVSGGGYIGSWLSAWIKRTGPNQVQAELARCGSYSRLPPETDEPKEVAWLRKYSNYLAPRLGLFSTDSLTLITTWARNVFLNLIVLVALTTCLLMVPRLLLQPAAWAVGHSTEYGYAASWFAIAYFVLIGVNLWRQGSPVRNKRAWFPTTTGVLATVLTPAILAALFGSIWLFGTGAFNIDMGASGIFLIVALLAMFGVAWLLWALFMAARGKRPWPPWGDIAIYIVATLVPLALAIVVASKAGARVAQISDFSKLAILLTLGPAGFLVAFGVCGSLFVGLVGRSYFERSREWWSRMNAWLLTLGVAWFVLCALAFYGAAFVEWAYDSLPAWGATLLGSGWIGSFLAAIMVPRPGGLSKAAGEYFDRILNAAAAFFVVGLVLLLAAALHWALLAPTSIKPATVPPLTDLSRVHVQLDAAKASITSNFATSETGPQFGAYRIARVGDLEAMSKDGLVTWLIPRLNYLQTIAAGALATLLLFAFRVDVNKFSLHNMYKNRLVRCYLGASNRRRQQQPFTGLDDDDDLSLADLKPKPHEHRSQRPFHIISAALNIAQGKNLAWQERKAASFAFSTVACGYRLAGTQGDASSVRTELEPLPAFQATSQYASEDPEERGITLGMAMATSGAAVSPNMGRATKPALAFLLTLFNLRLGRWSPNPARPEVRRPGPWFGLICLVQELFGASNEQRKFVYLSDGGHFENLGLYELVARKCDVIFVVDAGADPGRKFGDIAEAVRKCRVDFGVEITIDLEPLRGSDETQRCREGFAEGIVKYNPNHLGGRVGTLIVLKPSLRVDQGEPADVLGYAARNPSFPQQTTADQFFDESQFESYRRLGLFVAEQCLARHAWRLPYVILPPDAVPPAERVVPPHSLFPWFWGLLIASCATFGALSLLALGVLHVTDSLSCAVDAWWDPAPPSCAESLLRLLQAPTQSFAGAWNSLQTVISEKWLTGARAFTPLQAWFWLDNAFVVLYVALFIVSTLLLYRLWPGRPARTKWTDALLAAFIGAAIVGGFADYVENFQMLALTNKLQHSNLDTAAVAAWSALKFRMFAIGLVPTILCTIIAGGLIVRLRKRKGFNRP